jgi:alpha-L-arabinofuranosidase
MWVVNPNATSKEAAALVAFFNGYVTDTRIIGTDIRSIDWYTVGHWARLRASKGYTDPVPIKFWEFGNEVYASKASHATPSSAGLCQSWAWEDTWTCDGFEYVNGVGIGSSRREGYLEFKQAMQFVDPTIVVAAVGFEHPGTPSDTVSNSQTYAGWGSRVISAAGDDLDMYSIHPYPYYNLPSSMSATLSSPQTFWPTIISGIRNAFNAYANGRQAPIAVTEFNLVSVSSQDNNQWMTRAVNMLFLADSLGQAAQTGAAMFAQWDLANGRDTKNGTEYGLMHEDNNYYRAPQYYVYPLWSRFGSYMLPVTSTASPSTELSVYAGWVNSTTVSLLAVNKTNRPVTATITVSGFGPLIGGVAYEVKANSLMAQSVTYNGSADPSDNLSESPASFSASGHSVMRVLPAYSVVLLHLYQDPPAITPRAFVPITLH